MSHPTPSMMSDKDLAERYATRFFKFEKFIQHPGVRNEMAAIRAEIFNRITTSRDYTAMLELDERLTGRFLDERAILPVAARVLMHMQNVGTIGAANENLVSLFIRHYPQLPSSTGLNNSASVLAAKHLAPLPTIYQECENRVLAAGAADMDAWWAQFLAYKLSMGSLALALMAGMMSPPKPAMQVSMSGVTFGGMQ